MISIADLVPSTDMVFSIEHWPTGDHASRSASTPCRSGTDHLHSGLLSVYLGVTPGYSVINLAWTQGGVVAYQDRDAVIVGAIRTPIGKGKAGGALHNVLPADLLAHSLRELVARTGVDPVQIDDVIAGAVTQVGDQAVNIARNALLGAGFPESVPGVTIDRQCGSSQQAISFAAQGVLAGAYDLVIAGGVESMSRVPMGTQVLPGSNPFGEDMTRRYPEGLVPQGISAELIAAKWSFSRTQLDEFSASSHEKAARATKDGLFDNELIPIAGLETDEIIRPATTVETLATLQPSVYSEAMNEPFPQINWSITAGNSSPLSDGSAAVLITTSEVAAKLGLRPLARIHTTTVVRSEDHTSELQ